MFFRLLGPEFDVQGPLQLSVERRFQDHSRELQPLPDLQLVSIFLNNILIGIVSNGDAPFATSMLGGSTDP